MRASFKGDAYEDFSMSQQIYNLKCQNLLQTILSITISVIIIWSTKTIEKVTDKAGVVHEETHYKMEALQYCQILPWILTPFISTFIICLYRDTFGPETKRTQLICLIVKQLVFLVCFSTMYLLQIPRNQVFVTVVLIFLWILVLILDVCTFYAIKIWENSVEEEDWNIFEQGKSRSMTWNYAHEEVDI